MSGDTNEKLQCIYEMNVGHHASSISKSCHLSVKIFLHPRGAFSTTPLGLDPEMQAAKIAQLVEQ